MTGRTRTEGGSGFDTGSTFLGLGGRVRTLYRARRRSLIELPHGELVRRYGADHVVFDEVDYRSARTVRPDGATIEVGFKGNFRLFGALIDTQWIARKGEPGERAARYNYRFDRRAFATKALDSARDVAEALADEETRQLAGRSELKSMSVVHDPGGVHIELVPLAGTITAVYFPPLPPYTVPFKEGEVRDHVDLLEHLLDRCEGLG